MKFPVYSIRDTKAFNFQSPMVSTNDVTIQRAIAEQLTNNRNDIMSFSPSDFDLYRIGKFDIDSGVIEQENPIVLVANCAEVISNYARIEK